MDMKTKVTLIFFSILLTFNAKAQMGVEDKRHAFNNQRFYARTARMHDNAILVQIGQLPMSIRGTYEHRINQRYMVGVNLGVRVAGQEAGTIKSEVYGKLFVNNRAPQGLYLYGETGAAYINNHTFKYRVDFSQGETGQFSNPQTKLVYEQAESFMSLCGGLGFGFQNAFGSGRRTIVDFGLGYRFYSIPDRIRNQSFEENGLVYRNFSANNTIMSSLFPFNFRFGLGYMF
jgi:hypothetical protein